MKFFLIWFGVVSLIAFPPFYTYTHTVKFTVCKSCMSRIIKNVAGPAAPQERCQARAACILIWNRCMCIILARGATTAERVTGSTCSARDKCICMSLHTGPGGRKGSAGWLLLLFLLLLLLLLSNANLDVPQFGLYYISPEPNANGHIIIIIIITFIRTRRRTYVRFLLCVQWHVYTACPSREVKQNNSAERSRIKF